MEAAIVAGDVQAVDRIIEELKSNDKLPDLDKKNPRNGLAPIHVACLHGHSEIVSLLLDKGGVSIISEDNKGRLPLHCAVEGGNSVVLEEIIRATELRPGWLARCLTMRDLRGWTPLHIAASRRRMGKHDEKAAMIIDQLIDHMPEKSSTTSSSFLCRQARRNGGAAAVLGVLHKAILSGVPRVAEIIMDRHDELGIPDLADMLNDVDDKGMSPLIAASSQGELELVRKLVSAGSKIMHRDSNDQTAAHWAFAMGHAAVGDYLVALPRWGKELQVAVDKDRFTPEDWRRKVQNCALDDDEADAPFGRGEQVTEGSHHDMNCRRKSPPIVPSTGRRGARTQSTLAIDESKEPLSTDTRYEAPISAFVPKLVPGSPVFDARTGEAKWEDDRETLQRLIAKDSQQMLQRGIEACDIADQATAEQIGSYLDRLESPDQYWNVQGA